MDQHKYTLTEINTGFVVAISITAKEGEGDTIAALLESLIAPTLAEPGVKLFIPYRSPANPNAFFIFELYRDEKAWGEHEATAHFKETIPKIVARAAHRERVPYIPFAAIK